MIACRAALALVAALATLALAAPIAAHPLAPSLFDVREDDAGRVEVAWKTPLLQPAGADLRPELPLHCSRIDEPLASRDLTGVTLRWSAACGERGLLGERLWVRGLERTGTAALVRVALRDGRTVQAVLSGRDASLVVPLRQSAGAVLLDYTALGVEHILSGLDHLLFVLGLVLLVHGRRRLLATVTAFTVGHSVTLSLAVLGFVAFPTRLIEFGIALSILVLAAELSRSDAAGESRLRRRPWGLAFGFGLLHGLGFAGALAEVGLPPQEIPLSLFSFNLGIEFGQLVFIAAVLVLREAIRSGVRSAPPWLAGAPSYGIGSLSAYWCFERLAAFWR
jgi:hydrogenase/urease accessory protein HupE